MDRFPALFVSHGSPMIAITPNPAHHFLRELGPRLGRPRAILIATAHWTSPGGTSPGGTSPGGTSPGGTSPGGTSPQVIVGTAAEPETIHDFGGFPPALYALRYPAPGAPEVARRAGARLREAGFAVAEDAARGLDHGSWIPARLMYPEADIPIAQISIQPEADPTHHYRIGEALRPLRDEGVLILGSGSFTHNLRAAFGLMRGGGAAETELSFTAPFLAWIGDKVAAGDIAALLAYREQAPYSAENHPTDEHFLPFFTALGAATPGAIGERWHHSTDFGLAMDCYAFA